MHQEVCLFDASEGQAPNQTVALATANLEGISHRHRAVVEEAQVVACEVWCLVCMSKSHIRQQCLCTDGLESAENAQTPHIIAVFIGTLTLLQLPCFDKGLLQLMPSSVWRSLTISFPNIAFAAKQTSAG